MGWIALGLVIVVAVLMGWAYSGAAKGLGVYEEEERLNREADAREDR